MDEAASPYQSAIQQELRARVEEELRHVREPFRTTLVLRDLEELWYEEIAAAPRTESAASERCPVNIAILHAAGKKPAVEISGIPQKQGNMPAPAGTPKPADKKSREDTPLVPPFDCGPIQAVLRDAAERVYARLTKAMAAAAKHPEDFGQWRTNDAQRHAEPVASILRPAQSPRPGSRRRSQEPRSGRRHHRRRIRSCGDPSKFTVETILELMQ